MPAACEAHLGLARISYQWNDLDRAEEHAQQAVRLARLLEQTDRTGAGEVFLARLKLARGEAGCAAGLLAKAEGLSGDPRSTKLHALIAAVQVSLLQQQGHPAAAAQLAQRIGLPLSLAQVRLADGDPSAALAVLEPLREKAEAEGLEDERLQAIVLQAAALHALGGRARAVQQVSDALALAAPGGFIRLFIDGGAPVYRLLCEARARGIMPAYTGRLLAAFQAEQRAAAVDAEPYRLRPQLQPAESEHLTEPLSERELEVLRLIAEGLSNQEISERLFLALSTVKGHNRNMFDKLGVQRRTEAVARARRLGLL